MKKIYAFLAVAMMSVSLFATPEQIPTASDLVAAEYNPSTNVVLCLYLDPEGEAKVCNDIVLAGSYEDWKPEPEKCERFKELDGFDNWWVVEVPFVEGLMAKPVQLNNEGEFGSDWDFQSGDPEAWVPLGGLTAKIEVENGNESKVSYGSAGAYIYELKYWKAHKSPCVETPKYNYTIYLLQPECDDEEFVPVAVGSFSQWKNAPLSEGSIDLPEGHPDYDLNGEFAYMITFVGEAEQKLKFRESKCIDKDDWSNQLQFKDENGNWQDFTDYFLPAVVNGSDTAIVFDYSDTEKYRYTLCGVVLYDVTFSALLPEGAPEAGVELVGTFDGASYDEGVLMEFNGEYYTAKVKAYEMNQFKFRGVGSWEREILLFDYDKEDWTTDYYFTFGTNWRTNKDTQTATVEIDLSDPEDYKWIDHTEEGIENIVLTEKASKVVVDGQIYIIRDNKLFNIHGAQLR